MNAFMYIAVDLTLFFLNPVFMLSLFSDENNRYIFFFRRILIEKLTKVTVKINI